MAQIQRPALLISLFILTTFALGILLKLSPSAFAASCSASAATVTRTSSPVFYIDTGYTHGYVSYQIATSSSQTFNDLWVEISGFSSGNLARAASEDGLYRVGSMLASSSKTAYFYLQGAATAAAQTYTLRLYEGKPGAGGVEICNSAQSNTAVESTIQASSNKVTSVNYTAPYLGGDFTVTIIGDTGTIGSAKIFSYTPATQTGWNADCLELKSTSITLSGGNTGTFNNGLYLNVANTQDTNYVVKYTFTAKCVTASSTSVVPLSYISSGNDLKHTSTSNYGSLPPIAPATNSVTMNKTVSPAYSSNGGTATYSVDITNSGASAAVLDDIVDTLPSDPDPASYVNGSAQFDDDISGGAASSTISDPTKSGQTLTWIKTFTIAAGKTGRLTYQATIPSTAGSYTNSVVGHIGTTQIDKTVLTSDSVPATTSYGVGSISLSSSTKTAMDINGGTLQPGDTIDYTVDIIADGSGTATGVSLVDTIDSDTENLTSIIIGADGTDCGDTFVNNSTPTTVNVSSMTIPAGSHCLITYKTTVKATATNGTAVLNTASLTLTNPGGIGASPSSSPMTVQKTPTLNISITDNDADNVVIANQAVTYTVTISNTGQTNANGVDLVSTLTGPLSALGTPTLTNCGSVAVDTSALPTVNIAGLAVAVGTPCVVTYIVTVSSGVSSGQINNSTDITAAREGGNDPSVVTASSLLIGAAPTPPNLSGTIIDNDVDDLVEPGQKVTYTLTITNSGQTDATTSAIVTVDPLYQTPTNRTYTNCGSPSSSYAAPSLSFSSIVVLAGATCTIRYDVTLINPINEGTTVEQVFDIAAAQQGGNNPTAIDAPVLTVNATPILDVSKTSDVSGDSITANQAIRYTVTVSNTGNGDATGVSLSDTISGDVATISNFSFTNCGADYSNNTSGTSIDVTGLTISTTQSCVMEYTGTVSSSPTLGSTVSNTVEVSASPEGSNIPLPATAGPYTIFVLPNLSATKTEDDADDTVSIGQKVVYTVTITNSSSASGTTSFTDSINATFGIPSNVQFTNCGPSPSSSFASATLTVTNLVATNSNNCTVTYEVVVQSSATNGQTLSNSVDVAAASEGGNNPSPVSATTLTVSAVPTLDTSTHTVTDINGGVVAPGDTLRYTVTVINSGEGTGTGISVTNIVDTDIYNVTNIQFSNCGAPTDSSTSTKVELVNITTTTAINCVITYDATVKSPSVEGTQIESTATISAASEGGLGASPDAAVKIVDVTPAISINTISNPSAGPVVRNQTISYTTTISNMGNGTGTVDLSGIVGGPAANITNIQLTNCGTSYTDLTSGLSISISSLTVTTTSSCVITYDVTVSSSANNNDQITNNTDVSAANEGGSDPSAATQITHTVVLPNLSVTKTENAADNKVTVNQTVEYTITIQNTSTVNATTSLVDVISSGFETPSNVNFSGCGTTKTVDSYSPNLSISAIVILANSSCVITYDVKVKSNLANGYTLENTVDVAAAIEGGNDPNPVSSHTLTVSAIPTLENSTHSVVDENGGSVAPGDTLLYTINVINSGGASGTGVTVTNTIDLDLYDLSDVQFSNCGSPTNLSTETKLDIENITVTTTVNCVITYKVKVKKPSVDGTQISSTTTIEPATEGGLGASPFAATQTINVTPQINLVITANPSAGFVARNQKITYTVTLSNSGDGPGTTNLSGSISGLVSGIANVQLLNCGDAYVNSSAGLNLSVSALRVATTNACVVTFEATVSSLSNEDDTISIITDATAATEGGDKPEPTAALVHIVKTPQLLVGITDDDVDNKVTRGQVVTYTITIANGGAQKSTTSFVNSFSAGLSRPYSISVINCGSATNSSFDEQYYYLRNIEINPGTTCSVIYKMNVSLDLPDRDNLSNTVDVDQPIEGGNNPNITSADTLIVSVPSSQRSIISPLTTSPSPSPSSDPSPSPSPSPDAIGPNSSLNLNSPTIVGENKTEEGSAGLLQWFEKEVPTTVKTAVAATTAAAAMASIGWTFYHFGLFISFADKRLWLLGKHTPKRIRSKGNGIDSVIDVVHPKHKNGIKLPTKKNHTSWAAYTTSPGEKGIAVIAGDAGQGAALENISSITIGERFEVEMGDKNWKTFEVVSIKNTFNQEIEKMSRDGLPKVIDQLNIIGRLSEQGGGRWLVIETKEIPHPHLQVEAS